jgi:pilus assembly protein CpaE
LVVDDQPEFCVMAREVLAEHRGMVVVGEAHSGMEALQAVADLRPDAVLLDVEMPGMDGFTTAGQMRVRFPEVSVVLTSSYHTASYAKEALLLGALGFIPKSQLTAERLADVLLSQAR